MFKLESRLMARDSAFHAVLLTTIVLTAIALWNGARWISVQHEALAGAAAHERDALAKAKRMAAEYDAQPDRKVAYWRDPRDARGYANFLLVTYAGKPPRPLAILNAGQADLLPYYFRVTTDLRDSFVNSYEIENPHLLQSGRFDVAFVAIYMLPLMLIALCYGLCATERERGMLALFSVQAGSFMGVCLRRALLRYGALMAVFLGAVLAGLVLASVPLAESTTLMALAAWMGVVLGYSAFWLGLILLAISTGPTSVRNAFVLMGVWLVLLIALPALFNFVARVAHPVPSRVEYIVALRDATDDISGKRSRLLEQYFLDHPELIPEDGKVDAVPWTTARIVTVAELERRMRDIEARYRAQSDARHRLLGVLQYLAPPLLAQARLNAISGTDDERHRDFLSQVDHYHRSLRDFLNPRVILASRTKGTRICVDCPSVGGFYGFDEVPRFAYVEPAIRRDLAAAAALVLASAGLLLGGTALARLYRAAF